MLTKDIKRRIIFNLIAGVIIIGAFFAWDTFRIGNEVDYYHAVPVYHNGIFTDKVQGVNYSDDGYYYGLMWQCVEFVQRYYYDVLNHNMPDPEKDAKGYFEYEIGEGGPNETTGLRQFSNGGSEKPQVDDILVFVGGKFSKWGHVAIVSEIGDDYVEIVQQNVWNKPREELSLKISGKNYTIESDNELIGWLRQ